ncbi:peptidase inhibitor family I36 protein [Streptomyces sp. 71268]|uniref:peptidase inhibitor family I36 protein n=1 Tax=Streptomyces sp. 71268 TaxID=3002640 RepID=UPI0023F8231D|nr:peptidase inhibitor family I36 protein [Streptomyces sp. 71268]WEV26626.1 peptidase inhibitor family I36 protein [Streptomyces sp. 71268]
MNVRKRLVLFTAAATVSGGLVAAPSATAAFAEQHSETSATVLKAPKDCPKGYLCVYPKYNFKGKVKKVQDKNRDLRKYGGAFKAPKSAYNNGKKCKQAVVYAKPHFKPKGYKLNKGTGWKKIGSNLPTIYSNSWAGC